MKRNIGAVIGLYPTPTTMIGTIVNGKVNWSNVAHIGIIGLDCIMLSIKKPRYTNVGIKENKVVSVNIVTEEMIAAADYVGLVSGKNEDKSQVFAYHMGELNTPIIDQSPLAMECELVDIYDTKDYDNFILKVVHTHVEDKVLDENGKINYDQLKPVLFEMPTQSYYKMGEKVAKCWSVGIDLMKEK
jgi:flavin reductase (DIM6/NTAB) family NADH-FMN oxidoreductase RutF